MKQYVINSNESGQRFDKYLKKLLPNTTTSFLYKMLRKKNITLNGAKASGNEKLQTGDEVKLFFSDETFAKFTIDISALKKEYETFASYEVNKLPVVYEDSDIVVFNKPYNMLSQKAKPTDISVNELLLAYLIQTNQLSFESFQTFRPSICNRLDRNTTGLIVCGKSLEGLQKMGEALKERTIGKYYRCVVAGQVDTAQTVQGFLCKNKATNMVSIKDKPDSEEDKYIETAYQPLASNGRYTLLEVHLITGRTHQIRAHLSAIGHPIVGDMKYGNATINQECYQKYHVTHQLLHAYRLEFADGQKIIAELPKQFEKLYN